MTRTKKHSEKLADRRAEYGDRRVSRSLDRTAAEILAANPAIGLATARSMALKQMIAAMKGA